MAKSASKTTKKSTGKTAAKKAATRKPGPKAQAPALAPIIPIKPPEQHPLALSILLHLLPGVLATALFVVIAQPLAAQGIPAVAALLISALAVIIPFELGVLLWEARRRNQSSSLVGVVLYRAFLPWWQYIVFPLALIAWAILVFGGLMLLNPVIISTLFGWLPDWYRIDLLTPDTIGDYSRFGLILTVVLLAVVNALAAPIVEELYFRGYLLPRLSRYGKWASVINVVLFSLYHLWSPWENLTRIAALLPLAYVVWSKKNIYLGMITHVVLNTIGVVSTAVFILGNLP